MNSFTHLQWGVSGAHILGKFFGMEYGGMLLSFVNLLFFFHSLIQLLSGISHLWIFKIKLRLWNNFGGMGVWCISWFGDLILWQEGRWFLIRVIWLKKLVKTQFLKFNPSSFFLSHFEKKCHYFLVKITFCLNTYM